MKNKIIAMAFFFGLALLSMPVKADFVQVPITITVPTQLSFTLFTLGGSQNSATGLPYPLTENYYFNSSTGYNQLVAVCRTGDTSDCQAGMNKPAGRARNTGTVNISIGLMYNATLPTGFLSCVNSSKPTGCGGNTDALCLMGDLNSSQWAIIGTQLGTDAPCYEKNFTIYGNFSGVAGGTTVVGLTVNSTS